MRFLPGIFLFLVVSGIGFALLAVSLSLISKKIQWIKDAKTTSGRVVEIVTKESTITSSKNRGQTVSGRFPVIEFQAIDGKNYSVTLSMSVVLLRYEIGDFVTVQYHPDNESEAEVENYFAQFFMPMFLLFFGLIFFGAGCFAGWSKISGA